jgi:rhamnose transport system substrate-binding protein
VVAEFAIWNPIDLGYATAQVATALARSKAADPAQTIAAGRMGTITFDAEGVGAMAKPFIYDRSNVNEFAKVF